MSRLEPGTLLGPYEILSSLGAGGEGGGSVYKARDTRSERIVALRALPGEWAENSQVKQRAEFDIKAIASLNHPHICAPLEIHEQDESSFLVMEYLEGETLAARLERGPLSLAEALKVAVALAAALEQAHRLGVVHHAIQPSNVMLTESGPKLLNFGVSRWAESVRRPGEGYVAPEQTEGAGADARSDVFAFGSLLYEMVSGRAASAEPEPLSSVESSTPPMLEHVVMTCLARSPADRWQTARDLLAELEWISQHSTRTVMARPIAALHRRRGRRFRILVVAAALLVGVFSAATFSYVRGSGERDNFRFLTAGLGNIGNFAVSPDGRWIAHGGGRGGPRGAPADLVLQVRRIGSTTSQMLSGTEGGSLPFWSPDSRWIAFLQGGKLRKVEVSGGTPQDICEAPGFAGGSWNNAGKIVWGSPKGLFGVSDQGGGKPEALTTLEASETGHYWPYFLPDGQRYLYLAWSDQESNRAIVAGALDSKDKTRIMAAESNAVYAPPGYLLFRRGNALFAQAFSVRKLMLSGDPVRVADELTTGVSSRGNFSVSQNGVLSYSYNVNTGISFNVPTTVDSYPRQLTWVDRRGQVIETPGPRGQYRGVSVSPDGKRIAVHRHDGNGGDVWIIEPGGRPNLFTFDASRDNSMPVWSPDGTRIVYASLQKSKWGLYQNLSNGSGTEEVLFESELLKAPMSWVGKHIVFWVQDPKTAGDIWVLPLEGEKAPFPFANETFNETHPQVSPDGKWIAYTSNKQGNRNEIYVRPFPTGSGIWQVSTNGGDWPRWGNNKTLFYHASIGPGTAAIGTLFSVAVTAVGPEFKAGPPEGLMALLRLNPPHSGGDFHTYDVSSDGQRFLYFQIENLPANNAAAANVQYGADPPNGIAVVLNWLSSLQE